MARITIESALAEIKKQQHYIDILENHCNVLSGDSLETTVFKLYAKIQNVEETFKALNKCREDVPYHNSKEISMMIPKTSIEDTELEAFVKFLQKSGKRYHNKRS